MKHVAIYRQRLGEIADELRTALVKTYDNRIFYFSSSRRRAATNGAGADRAAERRCSTMTRGRSRSGSAPSTRRRNTRESPRPAAGFNSLGNGTGGSGQRVVALKRIDRRQAQDPRQLVQRAARFVERAPDRRGRRARGGRDSARGSTRRARAASASSRKTRAPIAARSACRQRDAQSRRHAGPPPFRMLWRRSNVSTSAIGPPLASSASRYAPTRAMLAALGRRDEQQPAVRPRQQLAVEEIASRRRRRALTSRRGTTIGVNARPDFARRARRAPRPGRPTPARGRRARVPWPTAITSLWKTPASIASGFCCANTVRAGSRPWRRAIAADASRVCRAGNCRGAGAPRRRPRGRRRRARRRARPPAPAKRV